MGNTSLDFNLIHNTMVMREEFLYKVFLDL